MAKRKPLVTQHLERISRDALEKYQKIIRQYVRRRRGVYALYRGNKLYYVGLASNLSGRLNRHIIDRHKESWDRFSVYLTIGDSHLKELESLILRVVRPVGNKMAGKFVKSEDLRHKFSADIRELQRQEHADLFERKGLIVGKVSAVKKKEMKGLRAVLAKYPKRPYKLRGKHKGKTIRAFIRKDGKIWFSGKAYLSPSTAAAAAVKRRTCNGWRFWHYERSPGDWVRLDEMRR
jgi:hypothetical protein